MERTKVEHWVGKRQVALSANFVQVSRKVLGLLPLPVLLISPTLLLQAYPQ
jgi:hypothetical protein